MSEDEEGVGAPLLPVLRAEVFRIELCRVGIVPLVHHDSGGRGHHRHALHGKDSLMTSAKGGWKGCGLPLIISTYLRLNVEGRGGGVRPKKWTW